MKRSVALATTWLVLVGCADHSDPTGVVEAYFRTLARDPVRNAELLSPAFHATHGLRYVTTADAEELRGGDTSALARPAASTTSLSGSQVAWLMVQMKPDYLAIASRLQPTLEAPRITGDRARLTARVRSATGPGFVQHFTLSRPDPGARWRIDAIEQEGVVEANLRAAIVAYPNTLHYQRMGITP